MAKYIRVMFYLIAVLSTTNVAAQSILDGEIVETASFSNPKERQRQLQCMAQNMYGKPATNHTRARLLWLRLL